MLNSTPPNPLSKEMAQLVLDQGELRLKAKLDIALAADSRAVSAASMFIGISTAVFGFAGVVYTANPPRPDVAIAAALAGVAFAISGAVCAFAARPTRFRLAGANPNNWWSDDVTSRPIEHCLWKESLNYASRIDDNLETMSNNAKLVTLALYIGTSAPFISLISWLVVRALL